MHKSSRLCSPPINATATNVFSDVPGSQPNPAGATVGRVAFVQLEKLFRECMAAGQTEPTPRHVEIILLAGGIGSFICTPTALISKPVAFADVVAELGHSRTLRA
jgi:hypothetical protein